MKQFLLLVFLISSSIFADEMAEFEKGFGEEGEIPQTQKEYYLKDKVDVGGAIYSDFFYYIYSNKSFKDDRFYNNNLGYFYVDAKLPADVRFFTKGRLKFDPTVDESELNPLTGTNYQKLTADLDEMKLMFDVNDAVFFTIGKQKIKYGSGVFWNPTDFLNDTMKNPFYSYDRRLGVTLIKTHVPIGVSNFYIVADINNAKNIDQIAYVARLEAPINTSELALTLKAKKNMATKLGVDVSASLYEIDVHLETAISKGSDKTFYTLQGTPYTDTKKTFWDITVGASYDWQYTDSRTMTLSLEYYYNQEGYNNPAVYPILWANAMFVPLNTGRQYGMFTVYIPKPGSWNRTNITLFNVANLVDSSVMTRAELIYMFTNDLNIGFNVTGHYGKSSGEFRQFGQLLDLGIRFELNF